MQMYEIRARKRFHRREIRFESSRTRRRRKIQRPFHNLSKDESRWCQLLRRVGARFHNAKTRATKESIDTRKGRTRKCRRLNKSDTNNISTAPGQRPSNVISAKGDKAARGIASCKRRLEKWNEIIKAFRAEALLHVVWAAFDKLLPDRSESSLALGNASCFVTRRLPGETRIAWVTHK